LSLLQRLAQCLKKLSFGVVVVVFPTVGGCGGVIVNAVKRVRFVSPSFVAIFSRNCCRVWFFFSVCVCLLTAAARETAATSTALQRRCRLALIRSCMPLCPNRQHINNSCCRQKPAINKCCSHIAAGELLFTNFGEMLTVGDDFCSFLCVY